MAYRKSSTNVSFVNFPHFLFPLTDGKFLQDVSYTHPTSNITDSQELDTHMPEVSQISICTSSLILYPTLDFGILPSSYCILLTCIPNPSSELTFNIPLLYLPRKNPSSSRYFQVPSILPPKYLSYFPHIFYGLGLTSRP